MQVKGTTRSGERGLALLIAVQVSACGRVGFSAVPCADPSIDCSGHGTCVTTPDGRARCACAPGYHNETPLACEVNAYGTVLPGVDAVGMDGAGPDHAGAERPGLDSGAGDRAPGGDLRLEDAAGSPDLRDAGGSADAAPADQASADAAPADQASADSATADAGSDAAADAAAPVPLLMALWHFNGGGGTRAFDDSGNNHTLTLPATGAAWAPLPEALSTSDHFPSPSVRSEGVIRSDGALWVSGRMPSYIYQLDPSVGLATGACSGGDGCVVGSFTAPGPFPEGLASDGQRLWHADGYGTVFLLDPAAGVAAGNCDSGNGCVLGSFPSPDASVYTESVSWQDPYLWLSHSGAGRIFKLDPAIGLAQGDCTEANGCVVDSLPAPGAYPEGVAERDGFVWNSDGYDGQIYKIDPVVGFANATCTQLNGCIVGAYESPADWPEDIGWEGDFLWHLDLWGVVHRLVYTPPQQCQKQDCLSFDGSGGPATFAASPTLDRIARALTVAAWILPTAGVDQTLLSYGYDSTSKMGIRLGLLSDKRLVFEAGYGGGQNMFAGQAIAVGLWTHVSVTWDGAMAQFYFDGSVAEVVTLPGPLALAPGGGELGGAVQLNQGFSGMIDEVHVFDGALDEAAVRALYENP